MLNSLYIAPLRCFFGKRIISRFRQVQNNLNKYKERFLRLRLELEEIMNTTKETVFCLQEGGELR